MAAGYLMCAGGRNTSDGPWLLALSTRLGARQDYPSLHQVYSSMPTISGLSRRDWDALSDRARALTRRQAVDEVRIRLAPWGSTGV